MMSASQRGYSSILDSIGRARSLINLDPNSDSFGCADREFWYYRTRADFASAPWQQLMLGFAVLASAETTHEPDRLTLVQDATAAMRAWIRSQHRNGSVDEWYRNENSYCATAFGLAGISQAALLIGERMAPEHLDEVVGGAERAADWLATRWNASVMNQNLAAALGLWCLGRLTGRPDWERHANAKYARLQSEQHVEGWFPEYGGADLGYSALALDLLAGADRWGMHEVLPMAERLSEFLAASVCQNGTVPGRLGSRGTSHAFAFGAEYLAEKVGAARVVRDAFRKGHSTGLLSGPGDVDDRYFAYFYFPQFALAYAQSNSGGFADAATPPYLEAPRQTDFVGCGLAIRKAGDVTLHLSRRLGGAVSVTRASSRPAYHLGYEIEDAWGHRYSSATWTDGALPGDALSATALFQGISEGRPLERWMIPFAIVVRLLVVPALAAAFSSLAKKLSIRPRRRLDARLTRRLRLDGDHMIIDDVIEVRRPQAVRNIRLACEVGMHSPSARIERADLLIDEGVLSSFAQLRGRTRIEIRTRIDLRSGASEFESLTPVNNV